MNVTGASFPFEAVNLIQHIAKSRFIAFDFEFSGVAGRTSGGGSGKLSLQQNYDEIRSAAQIYQILQVGVTVVTEDLEKGRYSVRPYNFNLSPLPALKESTLRRTWSYNSGAISFLMRNGFNMETPFTQGVHYLSRQEEQEVRSKLAEDDKKRSKIPDMVLKDDDTLFVDYIKKSINDWQAASRDDQESFLNIPAEDVKDPLPTTLNRYQVRLTHQVVRNEYPKLKTHGMGHFVQVTNPTAEQQANQEETKARNREREVSLAIGFRWILEAIMGGDISGLPHYYVRSAFEEGKEPGDCDAFIRDLQAQLGTQTRAIVGHNCLTDIVNMYRCFFGDLPEKVEDFASKFHALFPLVLDTKYLATLGSATWSNTSLRAVEEELNNEAKPSIHLPTGFDRYLFAANYHEAGFDSFVTAKIGLKLPAKLKREGKDIKMLAEHAKFVAETTDPVKEETSNNEVAQKLPGQEVSVPGITQVLGAAGIAPVSKVTSLLTAQTSVTGEVMEKANTPQETNVSTDISKVKHNDTVLAVKAVPSLSSQTTKAEVQKLKSISQKTNIFDMLEDDPHESTHTLTAAEEKEIEKKRIAQMVEKGELLPRWEEDGALWKLIGNKLQANATQEGVLDLGQEPERI
ncbi:hypothetical protein LTR84_012922 [Exophiala bonariae]|uniref:CAF1-domain-containing protein n=1 Tax=Exophiala bonariae TaxID=1690606 RepID=A0AAV9NDI3_9EURO|nr:hypothetical protein LTR84_012922 [Exophiala bonariae]